MFIQERLWSTVKRTKGCFGCGLDIFGMATGYVSVRTVRQFRPDRGKSMRTPVGLSKFAKPCQNPEFQDGYRTRVDSLGFDARKVIEEEFLLRVEVDDDLGKGFEEWKRGFWAARNQLIVIHEKKRFFERMCG